MTLETWINFFKSIDFVIPMIFFGGMFVAYIAIWHLKILDSYIEEDVNDIVRQGNYNRARRKKKRALNGYRSEIPSLKIPERSDALLDRNGRRIMKL